MIIFLFLTSCKKDESRISENQNLSISVQDKLGIEKQFAGFTFNNNSGSPELLANAHKSKNEIIKDLSAVKSQFDQYFKGRIVTLHTNFIPSTQNVAGTGDEGPGDTTILPTIVVTASNIQSGGMFSTFSLTFNYSNTAISGQALTLLGGTIGWWWNSGYSGSTGPNTGYTQGTATYFYGLGTYSMQYQLNYTYDPDAHTLTYSWSDAISNIN